MQMLPSELVPERLQISHVVHNEELHLFNFTPELFKVAFRHLSVPASAIEGILNLH